MYVIAFILSLVIVLALIPPLRKLAIRVDFVDRPTSRKIHKEPVPHLASIAIFLGFMIPYLILSRHWDSEMVSIIAGSLLILGIGMVDDWYKTRGKDFPALPKTVVQVGAAVIVYFSGISFVGVTIPFAGHMIVFPEWLQFILTILWIFGVTTVINFMDGLDGLSGGVAGISALTLFIVAISKGQTQSAIMAIILVGVALGYLKYNKPLSQNLYGGRGCHVYRLHARHHRAGRSLQAGYRHLDPGSGAGARRADLRQHLRDHQTLFERKTGIQGRPKPDSLPAVVLGAEPEAGRLVHLFDQRLPVAFLHHSNAAEQIFVNSQKLHACKQAWSFFSCYAGDRLRSIDRKIAFSSGGTARKINNVLNS